jgi:hypothetical protein
LPVLPASVLDLVKLTTQWQRLVGTARAQATRTWSTTCTGFATVTAALPQPAYKMVSWELDVTGPAGLGVRRLCESDSESGVPPRAVQVGRAPARGGGDQRTRISLAAAAAGMPPRVSTLIVLLVASLRLPVVVSSRARTRTPQSPSPSPSPICPGTGTGRPSPILPGGGDASSPVPVPDLSRSGIGDAHPSPIC